jgi:lysophospholipase L1-like esterase
LVSSTPIRFSSYYLDIGASESLGFQPTGVPGHNGAPTNVGYANDLVKREALKGVSLNLEQVGCPGDTVQSLLDPTNSDACYQAPTTQLTKATAYLSAHKSDPVLVTVDLGFNDVRPCLEADPVNESCLDQALAVTQQDLPIIMKHLKSASGPSTLFVGIEYSDPYLGYYLDGASGPARSSATLDGIDRFDALLVQLYTSEGIAVANVPSAFGVNDSSQTTVDNVGTIPYNVEEACKLTWFCDTTPFGPDDHPNNAGYSLIAGAIGAVLPMSW